VVASACLSLLVLAAATTESLDTPVEVNAGADANQNGFIGAMATYFLPFFIGIHLATRGLPCMHCLRPEYFMLSDLNGHRYGGHWAKSSGTIFSWELA